MQIASTFHVRQDDLRTTRVREVPLADGTALPGDSALLRIDRFALTSNNVTYGALGDALSYWRFFPVEEPGWGCIPAWGFGTVLQSNAAGLAPGERFYGYFPMASHVVLQPTALKEIGFVDGAAHRASLHPVYNRYVNSAKDLMYRPEEEDALMLLRPLFVTSFLIDDLLAENAFFGAGAVLLSSASSKTAYGTAFLLARRGQVEVIGLTSAANRDFVRSLGCYDRVLSYDEAGSIPAEPAVAYIDLAGNAALRSTLHHHFGDALRASCAVGLTNWDQMTHLRNAPRLPGAKPAQLFAPDLAAKRIADWGPEGFQQRLSEAWRAFVAQVKNPSSPWMQVSRAQGPAAVERVYRDLLEGRTDPRAGHVLSLAS